MKLFFTTFCTVLFGSLFAQTILTSQTTLTKTTIVYRSYEDLIARKNGLLRNYSRLPFKNDVFEYKVEGEKKQKRFKMKDSSYVGYESYIGKYFEIKCIYNQKVERFTTLLGGDKNYCLVESGRGVTTVNYYDDGYVSHMTGDQFVTWYPVKIENNKQIFYKNIRELMKDDSELLDLHEKEKKQNINQLETDSKYLKLYVLKHVLK